MPPGDAYPRKLRPKELDLLEGVLPPDRPGYRHYREMISAMVVLGEGKRGPGSLILGYPGEEAPDQSMPPSPVVAFGMVETTKGMFAVTVQESTGARVDVEIVSGSGQEVPDHFEEKRRWAYSNWLPGLASPATGSPVREVPIDANLTLAIVPQEKRIWLYDRVSGMNLLVPVTNFHNELMLTKGIRDPRIALDIGHFFAGQASYSDDDLREAFVRYNAPRQRVKVQARPPVPAAGGWFHTLKRLFGKEKR
jgi:hypothetical protein